MLEVEVGVVGLMWDLSWLQASDAGAGGGLAQREGWDVSWVDGP